MCYDVSFSSSIELITDYLPEIEIENMPEFSFDLNVHVQAQAYRKCGVILWEDGKYKFRFFEWGLIADYMQSPESLRKYRPMMCNAQSEKVLGDTRSYWHRIRQQRCLIPVTGIYEHRHIAGWKKKVPYYVRLKNRELFCIPGLYQYSPIPDPETGELTGTFTMLTRKANILMAQIHNGEPNAGRMPLFLPNREMELRWLDPRLTEVEMNGILNFEIPSEELIYHTVHTIRTTKPRPDEKYKNEFFEWPNLPAIEI